MKHSNNDLASTSQVKLAPGGTTKLKKKNSNFFLNRIYLRFYFYSHKALDRTSQVISEEKLRKRNMYLLESQTMTNDVKNWWKNTLDSNNLFSNKSEI